MAWTEYKAVQAENAAQLTQELVKDAREGWKPILMSAVQGLIVVILEHAPKNPGQS